MTRRFRYGRRSVGGSAGGLLLLALVVWPALPAGAAVAPRPAISSVAASPRAIPAAGASITVTVRVRHAVRCAFSGQRRPLGPIVAGPIVSCTSGHASVRLPVTRNPYRRVGTIHVLARAIGSDGHSATKTVTVAEAPGKGTASGVPIGSGGLGVETADIPDGAVGAAYTVTLKASGGTAPYRWSVEGGALPAGLRLSAGGVVSGTPTVAGSFTFGVQVGDAKRQTATSYYSLTITGPPPPPPTSSGGSPSGGGTIPTLQSTNWSGYALDGGPFTSVSGTFNVPTISPTSTDTATAEWVGLDGFAPTDPNVIQAGVLEKYISSAGFTFVGAWFELYPAPAFSIPLDVAPGDDVTVTIQQKGFAAWTIAVKDDSNGEVISDDVSYTGPALSAEWIVEAPFSVSRQAVETVGAFSPIAFKNLQVNPLAGQLNRLVMIQNGVPVATPSPLSPNGFVVGPGGVTPAAP